MAEASRVQSLVMVPHHAARPGNAHPPIPAFDQYRSVLGAHFLLPRRVRHMHVTPPRLPHPANRRDTQRMRVSGLPTPNEGSTLGVVTPNGAAIRAIRELRGLSLRRLAHLIGRDPGYLSRVEIGRQGAGDETLRRIAGELRIPLDAITREKTSDQHAGGGDDGAVGAR
ncbi:hypothetical protein CLM85_29295 [Streptomyces albidoflavus]|uniref:helix-turn-helix domain-containing protein n=1 Tax=Streptomyces albidoflavus TaxID=1886 RepID=UPI000BAE2B1C|nr:hypothetical protein CLM82_15265 [Streptomyces albidoflavus]PBO17362.1 hypothetical protein CLM83_18565 [Streptomyces albidoflavus]PBO21234.1 hypothetical protein CLM85_29295 [Streptomyces albidoflavus]PBO26589.1 hypothetical protein CLM84_30940 [Streptomyces albidoflavus]